MYKWDSSIKFSSHSKQSVDYKMPFYLRLIWHCSVFSSKLWLSVRERSSSCDVSAIPNSLFFTAQNHNSNRFSDKRICHGPGCYNIFKLWTIKFYNFEALRWYLFQKTISVINTSNEILIPILNRVSLLQRIIMCNRLKSQKWLNLQFFLHKILIRSSYVNALQSSARYTTAANKLDLPFFSE